ncbi:DUF4192 family protein [Streptomyces sp. NPDC000983]|uniref:DUF4192 domain-containing protein n=1 Tax=Streptomyces sp. NPDC000983 TaxID=3154373 RepID=UPI0033275DB5
MTNHGETAGNPENGDITGHQAHPANQAECTAYEGNDKRQQVTLRTPAELADALPYLLGYRPEDSIVLVALQDRDGRGRFGGRARLGVPANSDDWPSAARQLAHGLVTGSERRGARPEQIVAYVCQEPARGETGRQVVERLRPLVQKLRVECGHLDVPVIEALCISEGRFWSYCCVDEGCCPAAGTPMGLPGTSVLAAAATYAGLQVRGTLRELRARLLPWETGAALEQEVALDTAGMALVPRILDDSSRADVAGETLELAERLMNRLAAARPVSGTLTADLRDDDLLAHDEAARIILGLQDRSTRDRAAAWMEGDEAAPALRLWRALARRCVGPYSEHAAPPLTLAGWVAWSMGDELEAREALAMALAADPDYLFARLLHQACNEGLDPESVRRCLRAERAAEGTKTPPADGTSATDSASGTEKTAGTEKTSATDSAPTAEGDPWCRTQTAAPDTASDAAPNIAPADEPSKAPADTSLPRPATDAPGEQNGTSLRRSADRPKVRPRSGAGRPPTARVPRPRTPGGSTRPGSVRQTRTTRAPRGRRGGACQEGTNPGSEGEA